MRSIKVLVMFCCLFGFTAGNSYSQSQEIQQLVLNVEKLSQLKNILTDMKRGYEIVSKGYGTVKNIAQGNFSLHELFLDGLYLVSPEVRKYYKVGEIISQQKRIVIEYQSAFKRFQKSKLFSVAELSYLSRVYGDLLKQRLDHLDQLVMVVTANKLRMSDEERLAAIDGIFVSSEDKLVFLRSFNHQASMMALQREQEKADVKGLGNYYRSNE